MVGVAFDACLVTGGDGQVTMDFSWLEGIVEGEWLELRSGSLSRAHSGIDQRDGEAQGYTFQ